MPAPDISLPEGLKLHILPQLRDNYAYLLICTQSLHACLIDPADANVALQALDKWGARLTHIYNTHHHADHVAANLELQEKTQCQIAGLQLETARIPGLNLPLKPGDAFVFSHWHAQVLFTPGHTLDHSALYFAKAQLLFCGDTLFSAGCGRLFEGSAEQLYQNLHQTLGALPETTQIFCGHEYTLPNLQFALKLEPHNQALQTYTQQARQLRRQQQPTMPTTLGLEKAINPFLRCGLSAELEQSLTPYLGELPPTALNLFTVLRQLRNSA